MKRRKARPILRHTINVTILHDANASVASVDFTFFDPDTGEISNFHATGSAKRESGDRSSETIATSLSVGRALINLGHQMQDEGLELVAEAVQDENVARAERMLRHITPVNTPRLLPLDDLYERYGIEAAQIAAFRRGYENWVPPWMRGKHERPADYQMPG